MIRNTCFLKQIILGTYISFGSFVIPLTPNSLLALAYIHYLNIKEGNFSPLRYFELLLSLNGWYLKKIALGW